MREGMPHCARQSQLMWMFAARMTLVNVVISDWINLFMTPGVLGCRS